MTYTMQFIKSIQITKLPVILLLLVVTIGYAQQDPQYTQYMYNTMGVNPGYTGQRETLSITALHRSQWVGIDGAPRTQTLSLHSPLRNEALGLGLSVVNDALGPANETYIDANISYTITLNDYDLKLSFGLKGGIHLLNTDWSKGKYKNPDNAFKENISLFSPTIGAGLYLHSRKGYLGLSVPNVITTKHYSDITEVLSAERLHYYLIGGYVFDLSESTKLKPAFLIKAVSGAPLIADLSANFLFNDRFTVGAAWRWDDSFSALLGFQINEKLYMGYAYDLTSTELNNYNSGTHEFMLRYELRNLYRVLSPRFF